MEVSRKSRNGEVYIKTIIWMKLKGLLQDLGPVVKSKDTIFSFKRKEGLPVQFDQTCSVLVCILNVSGKK